MLPLLSGVTVTSPLCLHPSGVTPTTSSRPQVPAGHQEELHAPCWGQTPESWFTEEAAGVCCGSLVSVRMLHVSCWLTRSHLHRIRVSPGLCVSVMVIMWPYHYLITCRKWTKVQWKRKLSNISERCVKSAVKNKSDMLTTHFVWSVHVCFVSAGCFFLK